MFEKFINDLKNDKLKFATICVAIVAFVSGIVVTAANSGNTYASVATTASAEACYQCNSDSNILKWGTSTSSDSACPAGYRQFVDTSGDLVERPKATCKTYTVTINRNNGTTNSTIKKAHGSSFNLDSYEPTRTGYKFKGWEDKDGNTISGGTVTVTSNLSFSAIWENNTYFVK